MVIDDVEVILLTLEVKSSSGRIALAVISVRLCDGLLLVLSLIKNK